MKKLLGVALLLLLSGFARGEEADTISAPSAALLEYVQAPDNSFDWRIKREGNIGAAKYVELILTSQTWRDITWRHQLFILRPNTLKQPAKRGFLFITGGRWRDEVAQEGGDEKLPREAVVFAALAEQIQAPVAVLQQVPFQPMFGNKYEDEIIAYTFDRFLRTGDESWPLLLPMVKSAVKAMDAVQQFSQQHWELQLKEFTVTGASKRGWTTWLTGAVDPRAAAIAPMVIDMLNMSVQMEHQLATWGEYSNEIEDYTRLGLTSQSKSPAGRALESIVDPFSYRAKLTQPKLIILGTNDAYWPLDALNNYWNQLVGPKYILYVPNNGHGLNDLGRLTGSLSAFHEHTSNGTPLPDLNWSFAESEADGRITLKVRSDVQPKSVQAWIARSQTKDFRPATWSPVDCVANGDTFTYDFERPTSGYVAVFGEAVFNGRVLPFYLSTNVRIFGGEN